MDRTFFHVLFPSIVIARFFRFYKPLSTTNFSIKDFLNSKFVFLMNEINLSRNLIKGLFSFNTTDISSFAILYSLRVFSSVEFRDDNNNEIRKSWGGSSFSSSTTFILSCRWFTVKEDEGRTLWLDTQSHASSSASSADDDYTWQWPTSFWSQFKVSIHFPNVTAGECVCSD